MKKRLAVLVIAIFVLGGWSQASPAVGGKDLFQKVEQVKSSVEKGNWNEAKQRAKDLEKMYNKKRWKIMFLGDESEYEGLDVAIKRLRSVIDAKDKANSRMELAEIHGVLQNVYSF